MDPLTEIERDAAESWFVQQLASIASDETCETQAAMVERSAPIGFMPPLHARDEDETYRMLAGAVTFFVGSEEIEAEPGDVVIAPAGTERTFRVESEGARWLVLTRVASLERFLDFGRAVAAPVESPAEGWPHADDLAMVAAMGEANGIDVLGPPGALPIGH